MPRTLAKVSISMELIQAFITKSPPVILECTAGVPEDAVFISLVGSPRDGQVGAVFYHPSFPIVDFGAAIPAIDIDHKVLTWEEHLRRLGIAITDSK